MPMTTVKLYDADSFARQCTATVLSCEKTDARYAVVLDQTVFYPEGGGQPCDFGTLDGAAVTDVHEKDGVIIHTCDAPLTVGSTVTGRIDWARRFDHMQQHSGEHIVSGMLCEAFHCDNVGFHMGADCVTIDYNADISWEEIQKVEARANQYLWENHAFRAWYPEPEELKALPYRSKKALTGAVRITTFPGADLCACCGTHVRFSSQVGLVKFLSCQKFRDGVRLEVLFGGRALAYLARNWEENHRIAQLLSVKTGDTFAAVERREAELAAARGRVAELEEMVFAAIAEDCRGRGDVLRIESPMEPDAVRRLALAIGETCGGRSVVFAGACGVYKYALVQNGGETRGFVKAMNAALRGRGGGRDGFAQGSVQATEAEIRAFFERN